SFLLRHQHLLPHRFLYQDYTKQLQPIYNLQINYKQQLPRLVLEQGRQHDRQDQQEYLVMVLLHHTEQGDSHRVYLSKVVSIWHFLAKLTLVHRGENFSDQHVFLRSLAGYVWTYSTYILEHEFPILFLKQP
ncbi:unnamed protein product, partial [Schistosoma curassoni]|uniref:Ovule protein n=1 Tax=Schistosoma curassoni TaxID=6186 RepID=A0A183KXQ8_9TREM